jgi:hypothetical protein
MSRVVTESRYTYNTLNHAAVNGWGWETTSRIVPTIGTYKPIPAGTVETCCRAIVFAAIWVAWRIARCFRCGKLGKLTYSQLLAKYW